MSVPAMRRYCFSSPGQWGLGLAHRLSASSAGLNVSSSLTQQAVRLGSARNIGPASLGRDGTLYWLQDSQLLAWLPPAEEMPRYLQASPELASASRLVAGRRWLWTHQDKRAEITRRDLATLSCADTMCLVDVMGTGAHCEQFEVIDVAGDGCDGLWVLLSDTLKPLQLVHLTMQGKLLSAGTLPSCEGSATAIASLQAEVAILYGDTQRLQFVTTADLRQSGEVGLSTLAPGFEASCIGSDGVGEITVGGTVPAVGGRTVQVYVLRRSADTADVTDICSLSDAGGAGPASVVRSQQSLWVATERGMWSFGAATPSDPDPPAALFLTPTLTSPQTQSAKGWLRAELDLILPPGSSVELSFASTSDSTIRDAVQVIAAKSGQAGDAKITEIDAKLGGALSVRPVVFTGDETHLGSRTVSIPLNRPSGSATVGSNTDIWLWLRLQVSSGASGAQPTLQRLRVLYPDQSLMQHLPAIFGAEGQVNGFMRDLVGVFDTTTQGLDTVIRKLGQVMDPQHAPDDWLNYLAGWLDLPWDPGLSDRQRRAILQAAPTLLTHAGTRAALQAFLRCLFPDAAILIKDIAAELEPARVGGGRCAASPIGSLLSGWPVGLAVLGDKAVISHTRLACRLPSETSAAPIPAILQIAIGATAAEQASTPLALVQTLLLGVVPAESQIRLRWRRVATQSPIELDDGTLVLGGVGRSQLGVDSELGYSVIGGRDHSALTEYGLSTDERLQ